MTYQPDPQLVRSIADRIIRSEIDAIRDLGASDVGEMALDELEALYAQFGDDALGNDVSAADNAADILIAAVRKDICAAEITATWPVAAADAADDEPECGAEYSLNDSPCNLYPGHGGVHQNFGGHRWQHSLGERGAR